MSGAKAKTVTEYIQRAPIESRENLRALRRILKKVAPKAMEAIKWGSPVLEEKRILFAYSAFKSHINFMPTRSAVEPFKKKLTTYTTGRDTIQFPHDKPLPQSLILQIALFRAKQVRDENVHWMINSKKSSLKAKKK